VSARGHKLLERGERSGGGKVEREKRNGSRALKALVERARKKESHVE